MELLCSKTNKIWREYNIAFINLGANLRTDIFLNKNKNNIISFISKNNNHRLFSNIFVKSNEATDVLIKILKNLDRDKSIIIKYFKSLRYDMVSILSCAGGFWNKPRLYKLYIWNDCDLADFIPAMNCSEYKPKNLLFSPRQNFKLKKYIYFELATNIASVKAIQDSIRIMPYIPPNLIWNRGIMRKSDSDEYLIKKYSFWPIEDCQCKPRSLVCEWVSVLNFDTLLIRLKFLKNLKLLFLEDCYIENVNEFKKLLKMFNIKPELKIKSKKLELFEHFNSNETTDDSSEDDSYFDDISFKANEFFFVYKGKVFKVEADSQIIDCSGFIWNNKWVNNKWAIIDLQGFTTTKLKLTLCQDQSFSDCWISKFKESSIRKDSWYCIIFQKCISELFINNIRSLKFLNNWTNLEMINFVIDNVESKFGDIINTLSTALKAWSLEIRVMDQSNWIINKTEFWNLIIQFLEISFFTYNDDKIKIQWKSQNLNQDSFYNEEFMMVKNKVPEKTNFKQLWQFLTNNN